MIRVLAVAGLVLIVAGSMVLVSGAPVLRAEGTMEAVGPGEAAHVETFGDGGSLVLRYEHGEDGGYAFTLGNRAPIGVTITGVVLPEEAERLLFRPVGARADATDAVVGATDVGEFEPFVLGPAEHVRVVVVGNFGNCRYYTERALEVHDEITVEYRLGGLPTSQQVQLPAQVIVRSPTIQNCPDRVMDRSARQRRDPGE